MNIKRCFLLVFFFISFFSLNNIILAKESTAQGTIKSDRLGEFGMMLGGTPKNLEITDPVSGITVVYDLSNVLSGDIVSKKMGIYDTEVVPFKYGFYFWISSNGSTLYNSKINGVMYEWKCVYDEIDGYDYLKDIPLGFIRVDKNDGRKLIDGYGNEFKFLSINARFNNYLGSGGKSDRIRIADFELDDNAYKEIKSLGFTGVKLTFGYETFVRDDSKPYEYSEEAFSWLDQNIEWAKKNNIRLMLNAQYTQGGIHYTGDCLEFWDNPENQDYWIKLWQEIARRYADEPTILGYGILNEPHIKKYSSIAKLHWQTSDIEQRCIDAIRMYDKNHVISVDRALGTVPSSDILNDYYGNNWQYSLVNDYNMMFEWHDYKPNELTMSTPTGLYATYPDGLTHTYGIYTTGDVTTNRNWQKDTEIMSSSKYYNQYYNKSFPIFIGELGSIKVKDYDNIFDGGVMGCLFRDKLEVIKENGYNYSFHQWLANSMGYIYGNFTYGKGGYNNGTRIGYLTTIFTDVNNSYVSMLNNNSDNSDSNVVSITKVDLVEPTKKEYIQNYEQISYDGGFLNITYSDSSTSSISLSSSDILKSGFDNSSLGLNEITVSYHGFTKKFNVTIIPSFVVSVSLESLPSNLTYIKDTGKLNLSGAKLRVQYLGREDEIIDLESYSDIDDVSVSGFDNSSVGEKIITVTYCDKDVVFSIYIIDDTISNVSIVVLPVKRTYFVLENINLSGLELEVSFQSGKKENVLINNNIVDSDNNISISGFDNSKAGTSNVVLNYYNNKVFFDVDVINDEVSNVNIKSLPSKKTYLLNEELDLSGFSLNVSYKSGKSVVEFINNNTYLNNKFIDVTGFESKEIGTKKVSISYYGKSVSFDIDVIERVVHSIDIVSVPLKKVYVESESIDLTGLKLKVCYTNNECSDIDVSNEYISKNDDLVILGFDSSLIGSQTIEVVYCDKYKSSFEIEVIKRDTKELVSIGIIEYPYKNKYILNEEELDLSGGVLEALYSDGSKQKISLDNSDIIVNGFNNGSLGTVHVDIEYQNKKTSFDVEIIKLINDDLNVENVKTGNIDFYILVSILVISFLGIVFINKRLNNFSL